MNFKNQDLDFISEKLNTLKDQKFIAANYTFRKKLVVKIMILLPTMLYILGISFSHFKRISSNIHDLFYLVALIPIGIVFVRFILKVSK